MYVKVSYFQPITIVLPVSKGLMYKIDERVRPPYNYTKADFSHIFKKDF